MTWSAASKPGAPWSRRTCIRPPAARAPSPAPANMLLDALVACAGVTLKAVATAIDFDLKGGVVKAEGGSGFSRYPGRGQGRAGRLWRNSPDLRASDLRAPRAHCAINQADRALLRGVPDPGQTATSRADGQPAAIAVAGYSAVRVAVAVLVPPYPSLVV